MAKICDHSTANGRCKAVPSSQCSAGKDRQRSRQARGYAGDRGGLGDGEPCPHVEKRRHVAIDPADIHVLAAGVGEQGAQLRIGHRAEEREQAARDPRQIHQARRARGAHHFLGNEKDSAADDGAHHDGGGVRGVQHPGQIGCCAMNRPLKRAIQVCRDLGSVVVLEVLPVCLNMWLFCHGKGR